MTLMNDHNVNVVGKPSGSPIVFVHGFGCDQNMWRLITPAFEANHKLVLLDLIGSGSSKLARYDRTKYGSLDGHASDVLDIIRALELENVMLVGHSVGSMIAAIAANREPERITSIVMVAPSPCYLNRDGYVGGFSSEDIDGLLQTLEANYLGWSSQMAPVIMGNANPDELGGELTASFCRADPNTAAHFARVTFTSDHRATVKEVRQPCLILQCSDDIIAPVEVGNWLADNIRHGRLVNMKATGHCPHMSAPSETISAISAFTSQPD